MSSDRRVGVHTDHMEPDASISISATFVSFGKLNTLYTGILEVLTEKLSLLNNHQFPHVLNASF